MAIFQITVGKIISMFVFILIGYIMRKTNKLPGNARKSLSIILVNVCMPGLIFLNCAENMSVDNALSQSKILLCGVVVLLVGYVLGFLLSKLFGKDAFERNVYTYSFTIPNIGYMGAPLIGAVFGSEVLFHSLIFVFPMYLFIYSRGIQMLSPQFTNGIRGILLQPTILAILAGITVGLLDIQLPEAVKDVASSASGCVGPLAMILTGSILAEKRLLEMLKDKRAYIASLLRLLVIPFAAIGILVLSKADSDMVISAGAMLAMPLGLNTVVFPEASGGDGSKGASLALISHALSLVTIPLVFSLLTAYMNR